MLTLDPAPKLDLIELINVLVGEEFVEVRTTNLNHAAVPGNAGIFLGTYQGKQIITAENLVLDLFSESPSSVERRLLKEFPGTSIFACVLASPVNGWGYFINDPEIGRRIREGSHDDGIMIDIGTPLKEEEELFIQSELNGENQRIYRLKEYGDDLYTEDQVGELFVLALAERFFKTRFLKSDGFYSTKMTQFKRKVEQTLPPRY